MKHLVRISSSRVPAVACLSFAECFNGGYPICCGEPSVVDCIKCSFGLGSCKEDV